MTQRFPHDAIAAVSHPDPYPYYKHLVADMPFYYDETLKTWIASSADAVTAALSSDLCGVRPQAEPIPKSLLGSEAAEIFRNFIRMNDRDDHRHIKRAVARAIDLIDAARVVERSAAFGRMLLRQGSLPPTYGFQLPAHVIAELLGVAEDQLNHVSGLIGDFVRGVAPDSTMDVIEEGKSAAKRLARYFRSLLSSVDAGTSNSLLAAVNGELRKAGCEDVDVAIANAIGFLFQAHDATAALIGNALVVLSSRGELRALAAQDRGVLQAFIVEVVRFDSPVQNTRRYVKKSGMIAGQPVQAGDAILVLLAAANRDPIANRRADQFELGRKDPRVFTFGLGAHACPGAALATTMATEAIDCVMRSGVDLAPLLNTVRYRPSPNVRMPEFAQGD